ncbi:hypothetical protein OPV22_026730 [Ensete ventricosum]|uniref:Uncharacterized protein n=1 Tax=Ensete ventricosum TaxID=4639 RepID=A0AAV8Q3A8_ENSVE|nr:hypothetical protein OPV22_026730 [Ensete ventricosum]
MLGGNRRWEIGDVVGGKEIKEWKDGVVVVEPGEALEAVSTALLVLRLAFSHLPCRFPHFSFSILVLVLA